MTSPPDLDALFALANDAAAASCELRAQLDAEKAAHWRTCQTAAHEAEQVDSLRAELEAAKPDAKRYRWLREQDNEDFRFSVIRNPHFDIFESPVALDAAIDAALAREGL